MGVSSGLVAGLATGLVVGSISALLAGLLGGLIFGLSRDLDLELLNGPINGLIVLRGKIRPKETITWSWKNMGRSKHIVLGGMIALLLYCLVDFIIFRSGEVSLAIAGISGLSTIVLISGFSTKQLGEDVRRTPNQGIWRSTRNGLVAGLIVGLIIGLILGLVGNLISGLSFGLAFGLASGLQLGLAAFFQHFALRLCLWRTDSLPWNLVAFLDEATERLLLRKVGGLYFHPPLAARLLCYVEGLELRKLL